MPRSGSADTPWLPLLPLARDKRRLAYVAPGSAHAFQEMVTRPDRRLDWLLSVGPLNAPLDGDHAFANGVCTGFAGYLSAGGGRAQSKLPVYLLPDPAIGDD